MKSNTRKYVRILDSESTLMTKHRRLEFSGKDWRVIRDQQETINKKLSEYTKKLSELAPFITEDEFDEHLSDRMCCTWEDFTSNI